MIADLNPYPAMKDSGVEWLGDVPKHWKVRRGKWIFRHRKQINVGRTETNVLSLTLRGVVNNDPDNPEGLVPKDYETYQRFRKDDLVFKLIDLENIRTSRVGLVHEDGIMSSAYLRLVPYVDIEIRYFFQQYFDLYQRGVYNQLGAGVRSTLGPSDLLELPVLLPPLPEQNAIVRYLDYIDRRVRRLTQAKQKLVKLLSEQKQAIIHRAVTRGLAPDAPMKDSGVEWLGEVPEHWEVRRLGDSIMDCVNGVWGDEPDGMNDLPCVRVADFDRSRWRVKTPIPTHRSITTSERHRRMLKIGDLLIEKSGGGEQQPVGVVVLFDHQSEAVCSNFIARMPAQDGFDSGFLVYLHSSLYAIGLNKRSIKQTTGIQNLDASAYLCEVVAFPPLSEQTVIVEYLDKATAEIDAAIARAGREVDLLEEYRTRLVADVVTGKLDVRDAVASLPEVDPIPDERPDNTVSHGICRSLHSVVQSGGPEKASTEGG